MFSVPTEVPAVERARWLAELSEALDEAHRLLIGMDLPHERRIEARELHFRIQATLFEVQSLQLSRSLNPRAQNGPERMELPPWERGERKEA